MKSISVDIDLQNPIQAKSLPSLIDIQNWCELSIQSQSSTRAFENGLSVLIRVVDSVESADLNETYRKKKGPTNVLSFPTEVLDFGSDIPELNAELELQNSHLGDLVICESLVIKEASEQKKPLHSHWAHLIVHGTLHLQGFDHIIDSEAEQMETLEIKILEQLGFDNPYENFN